MKIKNLLIFTVLLSFSLNTFAFEKSKPIPIRVTPPAPKFSDAERQSELARRRSAVAAKMADKSMLILFSTDPKIYANDVNYVYRQENNLYYLTNLKQNNATLVLIKDGGKVQEILFMPKRNPQFETWNGKMYSTEEASTISGLKTIVENVPVAKGTEMTNELNLFLQSVKDKKPFATQNSSFSSSFIPETLYLLKGNPREYRKETEFSGSATGFKIESASPIFAELRLIKSPYEIKLLQHAIDITTEAHMRSWAMARRAKMEYEVQAEVEYTFRRRNADFWGYPSIVGCGPNATTLHYEEAQGEINSGSILLMDVGAEYEHYTADVTRSFPVNGKFSKEQAEIYQIVYNAQEAAAKATKPGANMTTVETAADDVIKNGLAKLGLITAPDATFQMSIQGRTIDMPQFRMWFMHGLGHWLGMNVHDVGDYNTPLKAGMVFTNEPGIYIRGDALDYMVDTPANKEFAAKVRAAFEKYKNIGIRIEDDMLVTDTGSEWLTKNLPRSIAEIEAFIAKAPKDLQYGGLPNISNPSLAVLDFDSNVFLNAASDSLSNLNGKTIRSGWTFSGKDTALSVLNHTEHSDGE
ncbi:MAG: aminopeptidase P N-terminal domain-containing protein [Pyrinomonadaceae bacterium]